LELQKLSRVVIAKRTMLFDHGQNNEKFGVIIWHYFLAITTLTQKSWANFLLHPNMCLNMMHRNVASFDRWQCDLVHSRTILIM
jgi:hypothetical protein